MSLTSRKVLLAKNTFDAGIVAAGGDQQGTDGFVNGRVNNVNEDKAAAGTLVRQEGKC